MVIDLIVIFCLAVGLIFFAGGTLGLLRFPDFYSRLHPAGKLDTMGSFLILLGSAIHQLFPLTLSTVLSGLKLMLIVVFVFLASPTATHAIVDAGFRAGLEPWKKGDPRR
ncbi:MAG: sodium:proton antiporter [Desulfobacca sp. 4484_104]|nr:MAG: sodium:proton antiporter [Desulfobacca sp. 4484_104]RLA89261.1 MAG: sodium:proton antiporter [Deltaproteobacteria bacterium]